MSLLDETIRHLLCNQLRYAQLLERDPNNPEHLKALQETKKDLEFVQGLKAEVDARTSNGSGNNKE